VTHLILAAASAEKALTISAKHAINQAISMSGDIQAISGG
jgi:hypothetical protein